MEMTPYIASIEDSLAAAAAAGNDETRRTADALTAALEPATRLAIMNALADLALEVSDALGDRVVELRLESGEVRVAVSPPSMLEDEPHDGAAEAVDLSGEPSRITLRLPEGLKEQAEQAAAAEAVSLNSWLIRAIQHALRAGAAPPGTSVGQAKHAHRVRGWVQG
jgi:predicted HicB family RNase H-like nuclease